MHKQQKLTRYRVGFFTIFFKKNKENNGENARINRFFTYKNDIMNKGMFFVISMKNMI